MPTKSYALILSQALQSSTVRKDIVERLFLDRIGWSKLDFLMRGKEEMPLEQQEQFAFDLKRLVSGEPLQYILGAEWFYGREFIVTKETLIPRPETELLVEAVLTYYGSNAPERLVDIGTGTGCIGITLRSELPNTAVTLVDISTGALAVAQQNSAKHHVDVQLVQSDLCAQLTGRFDCIVSNPPYIASSEQSQMDQSVIDYEPHIALFAENNGLAIYERLAKELPNYLTDNGTIFLEIGYQQGEAVKALFEKAFPTKTVHILKDYSDHDRVITVTN